MTESTPSTKIGFGAKNKLSAVLASKQLDAFDLVCFDNQEFGWINKFGQPVISTPRTQTAIKVNGVEGLGIANGTEIPAGQSFDDITCAFTIFCGTVAMISFIPQQAPP